MFTRKKKEMPGLNTTSTADISFMLLIFFLVTSSMDTDWGLPRQLPPPDDLTKEEELVVKQRNALCLKLNANNQLTCNDEPMAIDDLSKRVEDFVANTADDPTLPELSVREVHLLGQPKGYLRLLFPDAECCGSRLQPPTQRIGPQTIPAPLRSV